MAAISESEAFENADADRLRDVDALLDTVITGPAESVLGGFLEARMANRGWSALELGARAGLAEAPILDLIAGRVPAEALTDEALVQLARALDYQPNVLRILLDRPIKPTRMPPQREKLLDEYNDEIERWMADIRQLLVSDAPTFTQEDERRGALYDVVVRHIETVIARHRDDMRVVDELTEQLIISHVEEQHGRRELNQIDVHRIILHIQRTR